MSEFLNHTGCCHIAAVVLYFTLTKLTKGASYMHWITPNIQLMFGSIKVSYGRSLPVCRK